MSGSAVLLAVVLAGALYLPLHERAVRSEPSSSTISHTGTSTAPTQADIKNQTTLHQQVLGAQDDPAKKADPKSKVAQAQQAVNEAHDRQDLSDQESKIILDKLTELQTFVGSLGNMSPGDQRQAVIKESNDVRQWAAKNHIPYHYVDVFDN